MRARWAVPAALAVVLACAPARAELRARTMARDGGGSRVSGAWGGTTAGYPLYIENFAGKFNAAFGVPAGLEKVGDGGVKPYERADQAGNFELVLSATGTAGSTSVTLSGVGLADAGVGGGLGEGPWAAVAQHDDGTWGAYTVSALDTGTGAATIYPALTKAITGGAFANLHSNHLGQHYTPSGYKALAEHVWNYPVHAAYREKFVAQKTDGVTTDWTWYENGSAWFGGPTTANVFNAPASNPLGTHILARYTEFSFYYPSKASAVQWSQALGGKSGYVDTYIATATATNPAQVQIIVDGVTVTDVTTHGFARITGRYTNATTGIVRIRSSDGGGFAVYQHRVGATTFWTLPPTIDKSARVFRRGERVVYLGDSWGAYYNGAGPAQLDTYLRTIGGRVVANPSVGGKTSQWARDNFQSLVLAYRPSAVVIEFFTNDSGGADGMTFDLWKANIQWLCAQAIANGIQPIVIMPAQTAVSNQSQLHAQWAARLAEGVAE